MSIARIHGCSGDQTIRGGGSGIVPRIMRIKHVALMVWPRVLSDLRMLVVAALTVVCITRLLVQQVQVLLERIHLAGLLVELFIGEVVRRIL